jgi:hypothetical protein
MRWRCPGLALAVTDSTALGVGEEAGSPPFS